MNRSDKSINSGGRPKFDVGQKVLVIDVTSITSRDAADGASASSVNDDNKRPLYEATIRKSSLKDVDPISGKILPERKKRKGGGRKSPQASAGGGEGKEWCHLIHYSGWNSRHDKWIAEVDIYPDTPANRKRVGVNYTADGKVAATSPTKKRGRDDEDTDDSSVSSSSSSSSSISSSSSSSSSTSSSSDDESVIIYQNNLQLITNACTLPFTLQTKLVNDHAHLTKRIYPPPSFHSTKSNVVANSNRGITMLHQLPSSYNIIQIMKQYINVKKHTDLEEFSKQYDHVVKEADKEAIATRTKAELKLRKKKRKKFVTNIVALFDLSLPLFLLYKEEREQYSSFMSEEVGADGNEEEEDANMKRPSAIYGAEHLLRFFVKLPLVLSQYDPNKKKKGGAGKVASDDNSTSSTDDYILMSEEQSQEFAELLSELIVFLQKNLDYFAEKYFAVRV